MRLTCVAALLYVCVQTVLALRARAAGGDVRQCCVNTDCIVR